MLFHILEFVLPRNYFRFTHQFLLIFVFDWLIIYYFHVLKSFHYNSRCTCPAVGLILNQSWGILEGFCLYFCYVLICLCFRKCISISNVVVLALSVFLDNVLLDFLTHLVCAEIESISLIQPSWCPCPSKLDCFLYTQPDVRWFIQSLISRGSLPRIPCLPCLEMSCCLVFTESLKTCPKNRLVCY